MAMRRRPQVGVVDENEMEREAIDGALERVSRGSARRPEPVEVEPDDRGVVDVGARGGATTQNIPEPTPVDALSRSGVLDPDAKFPGMPLPDDDDRYDGDDATFGPPPPKPLPKIATPPMTDIPPATDVAPGPLPGETGVPGVGTGAPGAGGALARYGTGNIPGAENVQFGDPSRMRGFNTEAWSGGQPGYDANTIKNTFGKIASRYEPKPSSLQAIVNDPEFQQYFPGATVDGKDKIDFGDGRPVDVLIQADPNTDTAQGWAFQTQDDLGAMGDLGGGGGGGGFGGLGGAQDYQAAYAQLSSMLDPNASREDMEAAIEAAFGHLPGYEQAYKESVKINGVWYDLVGGYGGPGAKWQGLMPKRESGSSQSFSPMDVTGGGGDESILDEIMASIDALARGEEDPMTKKAISEQLAQMGGGR